MDNAGKIKKFLKSKIFTLVVILLLIMLFFWLASPNHSYLSIRNITSILNSMVLYILFAVGVSMPILLGEFDLSSGYVGTAAGALMAKLATDVGVPWYFVIIICLLLGIAFGLLNSTLIIKFRIQSFIATLAVGSFVARGVSLIVSDGKPINIEDPVIVWIGTYKIGDIIPVTVVISLLVILIYGIILAKTKFGRSIYLCGGGRQAARLAGLNPDRLTYVLFANSGLLGAIAGILFAARLKTGDLSGTNAYSFPAITAVIFGGVSLGGGSGSMLGCFLGLLIINGFNNGLTILRVTSYWRDVASGVLLILALTLDYFNNRRTFGMEIPKVQKHEPVAAAEQADAGAAQFLEFTNISKSFPGVQALDNVSFRADGGRVCALMGENGAGKSTLLKILSGDLQPDEGHMYINGEVKSFTAPDQSIKASISVIYQERQLVSAMSVMENIFLDDLHENRLGFIDKPQLRRKTQEIIDAFGLPIKPTDVVGRLSVAHQQMIEIMKAYRRDSDIFAFDEPTAPLTAGEITVLFNLIRKLKERGKIIIYVSHRMAEVFQISDDIIVLKDGQLVTKFKTTETDERDLVKAMVGRDIGDTYANLRRNDKVGDVILEVKNLVTEYVHDVSFTLRRGEVLGFAGLIGAGRTEVMRAVFGADPVISGEMWLDGKAVSFKSPKNAIDSGIALCPEDRKEQGLVLGRSLRENISIPVLSRVRKRLFIDVKKEERLAATAVKKYSIKTPTIEKLMLELSGGNQQKTILGRWTSEMMDTKILILDEPTKGIDVGTKAEVYQTVHDLASLGIGVIFISSELIEVLNISDRIIVMHNGGITGEVTRYEATEERVLELAMKD